MPAVSSLYPSLESHASSKNLARKSMGASFQDALKILVTMVKNQSPDQPMDAKEFGDQIIKFMSVEQNMKTNENLDRLIKVQNTTQALSALPIVGHDAVVEGQIFEHGRNPVHIQYTLPQAPKAGLMMILDHQRNRVVRHLNDIPMHAGTFEVPFDGQDDEGHTLPPGVYRAVFLARDDKDQEIKPKMWIRSKVTGIRHQEHQPVLLFGDAGHTLDSILEVRQNEPLPPPDLRPVLRE